MASSLAQQPIECLDAIALEIDKAKDILSLSLTCKALYSLVFYRHLRFRVIACRLGHQSSLEVWDLLARNKSLARSVRVLDIRLDAMNGGPRQIIPLDSEKSKQGPHTKKRTKRKRKGRLSPYERCATGILDYFIPALRQMTRLASFSWHPENVFHDDPQNLQAKICDALNSCKNLQRISIRPHWCNIEEVFFKAMDLSEVTEFEWSSPIPINFPPFEQALTRGLQNLESLKLNLVHKRNFPTTTILESCTWPKLRRLELDGFGLYDGDGAINRLLTRLPSIEILTLGPALRLSDLPVGPLPNLRVLQCTSEREAVPILSHNIPGSLQTLIVRYLYSIWHEQTTGFQQLLKNIQKHGSLEHFTVLDLSLRDANRVRALIDSLPNLKTFNGCVHDGDVESLLTRLLTKNVVDTDAWQDREPGFLEFIMS